MNIIRFFVVVFFALAMQAAEPVARITTDRAQYALSGDMAIRSTFTPDRDVYLVNCNGAFGSGLQRFDRGRWEDAWVAASDACYSQPIFVRKGGTHSGLLEVRRGAGAVVGGARLHPGTYRVVWYGVILTPNGTEDLPLELRVSAPFEITESSSR